MNDGQEPIAADELLFRRIPASQGWYDPSTGELKAEAFSPHKTMDTTGLSLSRARYSTVDEAAIGRSGKSYYVATISARDVIAAGIAIEPRPDTSEGYDPAHAELPDLNSGNRKDNLTLERQAILASLKLKVEGPYTTP